MICIIDALHDCRVKHVCAIHAIEKLTAGSDHRLGANVPGMPRNAIVGYGFAPKEASLRHGPLASVWIQGCPCYYLKRKQWQRTSVNQTRQVVDKC